MVESVFSTMTNAPMLYGQMVESVFSTFEHWLIFSPLPGLVNDHKWVWPICEVLHFVGLVLLVGTVAAVDLRMLGVGKVFPFAPLHRLTRWGIVGFVINLLTGLTFIAGAIPFVYSILPKVGYKVLFIALAGINLLIFRLTVFRKVMTLGPGEDAPVLAKVIAAASLFFWFEVIWWGRRFMI